VRIAGGEDRQRLLGLDPPFFEQRGRHRDLGPDRIALFLKRGPGLGLRVAGLTTLIAKPRFIVRSDRLSVFLKIGDVRAGLVRRRQICGVVLSCRVGLARCFALAARLTAAGA
jgi:hypothetical protein